MGLDYLRSRQMGLFLLLATCAAGREVRGLAQESTNSPLAAPLPGLWKTETAEGFNKGAHELELLAGVGIGTPIIHGEHAHDWVLGSLQYGWVFTDVLAPDRWHRGNWELLAHFFGGEQFNPSHAYLIGAAPLLRYNFAPGGRWVPFIDFGAGVTATDIRDGDLSTTFEFNLQAGAGTHFFLRKDLALTFQYRFIHLSNAGIDFPNLGVNTSNFMLGLSWFF